MQFIFNPSLKNNHEIKNFKSKEIITKSANSVLVLLTVGEKVTFHVCCLKTAKQIKRS